MCGSLLVKCHDRKRLISCDLEAGFLWENPSDLSHLRLFLSEKEENQCCQLVSLTRLRETHDAARACVCVCGTRTSFEVEGVKSLHDFSAHEY